MIRRLVVTLAIALPAMCIAAEPATTRKEWTRSEDVIYGRKFGMALTMDVFTPQGRTNGAGVIFCVSGGWVSAHEAIHAGLLEEFLRRGYVVFAVVHGSQPLFPVNEVVEDMHRAVRFIRHHAGRYGLDPDRLGITGGSAGGHLSLMMGMAGRAADPQAKDPVDRESSRVQAVACFFPPTDFLNYGRTGRDVFQALREELAAFRAPFEFRELDKQTKCFVPITDEARRMELARQISPAAHVSPDDPPTLIVHGDADKLVPIQQAEIIIGKLKEAGVPARLVVKPGAGHGWPDLVKDISILADWFDQYLAGASTTRPAPQGG